MDYDLSEVMFITTANKLYSIPAPLQDRMEIIRLAGYTEVEKLQIAEQFLIPKQCAANGLTKENIQFSENAVFTLIRQYTREAGVRNLEREIATICRKVAREVAVKGEGHQVKVDSQIVPKYLGVPKFRFGLTKRPMKSGWPRVWPGPNSVASSSIPRWRSCPGRASSSSPANWGKSCRSRPRPP